MSHSTDINPSDNLDLKRRNRLIGGLALIGLGVFLFIAQFIEARWMGMLVLPGLGTAFLVWGLLARNPGLLIPAGILSGLGLGTYLVSGPYAEAAEVTQGAVFLVAFGGGWLLIVLTSLLIGRRQWWPLIPGGILAVVGAMLLGGETGQMVLEWIGRLWPLALVIGGVAILLRRAR